jgi:hypothetical protein
LRIRVLSAAALFLWGQTSLAAQAVETQLSGEVTSSAAWIWGETSPAGSLAGWAGLNGGTRDVKVELRATATNAADPASPPVGVLDRALLKFRFPGVRFLTGWGKLAWGPGLVLPAADLLFGPASASTWLAESWVSLGDEAFAELAGTRDQWGVRVSVAPWGVTLEAAVTANMQGFRSGALSAQAHLLLDWYLATRWDGAVPTLAAGAFGSWTLNEDLTLTTRHEGMAVSSNPLPYVDFAPGWSLWDDVTLAWSEGVSVSFRATGKASDAEVWGRWTPSVAAVWKPLQNLTVSASQTLTEPLVSTLGVTAGW